MRVYKILSKDDVKSRVSRVKHFTKKEEKFLLDNYENMSVSQIATELNRTKESIYNKAKRLGISKSAYKRNPKKQKYFKISLEQLRDFFMNDSYELIENKYYIVIFYRGIYLCKIKVYSVI